MHFMILQWIVSTFTLICLIGLTIYHSKHAHHQLKRSGEKLRIYSLLSFSFIVLIIGILYCIFSIWSNIVQSNNYFIEKLFNKTYCIFTVTTFSNLYGLFKTVTYLSLCLKLMGSFKGSFAVYSKTFYIIWQIFIISFTVILLITSIAQQKIDYINGVCTFNLSPLIMMTIILGDFFICSVNLYLFLRPLCILRNKNKSHDVTESFHSLIKKNAILASISMVTTISQWLIIAVFISSIMICQILDILVTTFCIVLLFKWNGKLYTKLCCCCVKNNNNEMVMKKVISTTDAGSITTAATSGQQ
eukprot:332316_1